MSFCRASLAVAALLLVTAGCAQRPGAAPRPAATAATPRLLVMPPPSADLHYPPTTLQDLATLASRGAGRRLIGMENGPDQGCSLAWVKVHEVDGTPPEQVAADLMQTALARHVLTSGCGGMVYGTTNVAYCNCYVGDHGLLTIERGALYQLPPGLMRVTFQATDTGSSPADWEVTVPAPDVT